VRDKRQLTQLLIDQLPEQYRAPVDEIYPIWWQNLRSGGGMRLTDRGYDMFCTVLELEHYRYPLAGLDLRDIMNLDRKLQSPYYVEFRKRVSHNLVLFGSQEAVLINLYGDLKKFLAKHS
jgi:hypothetical protein